MGNYSLLRVTYQPLCCWMLALRTVTPIAPDSLSAFDSSSTFRREGESLSLWWLSGWGETKMEMSGPTILTLASLRHGGVSSALHIGISTREPLPSHWPV